MRVNSLLYCFLFPLLFTTTSLAWGPVGHQWISHRALDSLVGKFEVLQVRHRAELVERSMSADYRKEQDSEEASRHFVHVEWYGRDLFKDSGMDLDRLVVQFGREETRRNGTGPWAAGETFDRLVEAFRRKDLESILSSAADLSHYIADLHQPLHTTDNFNGQLTGQPDIHARFESQLLNRFQSQIVFDRVDAVDSGPVLPALFDLVLESHQGLEVLLGADNRIVSELALDPGAYRKRGSEQNYPERYFTRMFDEVGGLLEERLNLAAHRVASLWWMAWKQAGEPEF
ncbi:MAG: hypothetical protein V3R94_11855 [Acidobacteriota bacterium]